MSDLFWLTDAQMARLRPFFPKSHGKPRVDGRKVLNGIIFFNRNGLRWRDVPSDDGQHKTLYNHWKRWSDKGASRASCQNKDRNKVEIMFGRFKDWRRVAMRFDRNLTVLLSAVALAAIVIF